MKVSFVVPGIPVGKARPRVTKYGTFTPKKTREYEAKIQECWFRQSGVKLPDETPIKMTVIAYFPVPKSYSKKKRMFLLGHAHTKLPDLDNIVKSASDACQGYAFKNDSFISDISAKKEYSDNPRMVVIFEGEDK